jgi:hypothetical protein
MMKWMVGLAWYRYVELKLWRCPIPHVQVYGVVADGCVANGTSSDGKFIPRPVGKPVDLIRTVTSNSAYQHFFFCVQLLLHASGCDHAVQFYFTEAKKKAAFHLAEW